MQSASIAEDGMSGPPQTVFKPPPLIIDKDHPSDADDEATLPRGSSLKLVNDPRLMDSHPNTHYQHDSIPPVPPIPAIHLASQPMIPQSLVSPSMDASLSHAIPTIQIPRTTTITSLHPTIPTPGVSLIPSEKDLRLLLIYTKSVPKPKAREVFKELRTRMRLVQFLVALGVGSALGTSVWETNYDYAFLGESKVGYVILTALSSLATFVGVPPHRHKRVSRIEVIVDMIFVGFWFSASYVMINSNCPQKFKNVGDQLRETLKGPIGKVQSHVLEARSEPSLESNLEPVGCTAWNVSLSFGFFLVLLFFITLYVGVRDVYTNGWFRNGLEGSRGNWKDSDSDDED